MTTTGASQEERKIWTPFTSIAIVVATVWLATNFYSQPIVGYVICAALLYVLFVIYSFREPLAFITVFLVVLIVFPPFFLERTGDTPLYVSLLLLPAGLATVVVRWFDLHLQWDSVAKGLYLFVLGSGASLPFAWWFSGSEIASQGLFRWLMLAQTLLVYVLVRGGMRHRPGRAEKLLLPILIVSSVVSASYGIWDFFWPVPIPHPAAPQFLYLTGGFLRRAQGVFYESSNFGNICGFFLALISGAYLAGREDAIGVPDKWLLVFMIILSGAVVLAFSRSSWANIAVTMVVFTCMAGRIRWRRRLPVLMVLCTPLVFLAIYLPEIWQYLLSYRLGGLGFLLSDPNLASSGRFDVWIHIFSILYRYPHYFLLGVGYKTLPLTRLFGEQIITDNGFLNLLLETGILGLATFMIFLLSILKTFQRLSRTKNPVISFWATFLFAFWCGQSVQLLAADSYTYWRNMAVYVALMAMVENWAEREASAGADADCPDSAV